MTSITLPPVPNVPVSHRYRPAVYQAFANLIQSPDIHGIGANVLDLEILRLACLEKVRRDGPNAKYETDTGFRLNFLANIRAPWADERVLYWHEGLGYYWNLLVFEAPLATLLEATLFHGARPYIFALYPLPARLPGTDWENHDDYAICRRNDAAPPLTKEEKARWDQVGLAYYDHPYEWSDDL